MTRNQAELLGFTLLLNTGESALKRLGFRFVPPGKSGSRLGYWIAKNARRSCTSKNPAPTESRRLFWIPGFGDSALSMVPTALLLFPWILRHFDEMAICEFPGYAGKLLNHRPLSSSSELSFELRLLQNVIRPTHLVGHSMGGAMAAFLATDSAPSQEKAGRTSTPDLKQLILMNPAGLYPNRAAQAKIEGFFLRAHQQGHLDGLRDKFFFKEPPGFRWSIPAVKKFVSAPEIRMLLEEGKKPIPANDDLNHRLQHLTVPTHILWGKDDQLIPSRFFKLWKEKIPKDSLKSATQILNCGHAPQTERPAITAALLYELLINQRPPQGIDPTNRKLAPFLKIPTRIQSEIKPYPGYKLKDLSRND